MNESKRLLKNTGIIAIGNISTRLVSFLLLPLYTAILSASEYGIVDYITSIVTFCVPFVSILMEESIFRFLIDCKDKSEEKKVISNSFIIVTVGMIIFTLVAIPIMIFIRYKYAFYIIVYVILNVISCMLSALLRGIGRTDLFAIFNSVSGIIQIVLNVIFVVCFRWGLYGLLWASILAQIIVSLIYIFKIKLWKYISLINFDMRLSKEMIKYAFPLIPNKITWTIINLSDRIILMNLVGSEATGLYAVSYKFPNLMDTIYGFFYQSWKESSARVVGNSSQDDFYNMVYKYLKSFMFSICLGMTAFMPLVFKLLINKSYYEAVFYVPILLIGTYFANISGFYGGVFTAYKDTKIMGTTTIVAAIINLVTNLALIKFIGIYAAAISTFLAKFVIYVYRKYKVRKYIILDENNIESIISVAITGIIFILFYMNKIQCTIIGCAISIIYFVFANRELIKNVCSRLRK